MSATVDTGKLSNYFGTALNVIEIPGKTYPVEQIFLEDFLEISHYKVEVTSKYFTTSQMHYYDDSYDKPPNEIEDNSLTLKQLRCRYKGEFFLFTFLLIKK